MRRKIVRYTADYGKITFIVEGVICVKTFRSTVPFPKLPSQGLLTGGGKHRLSDQIMQLERQTIGNIGWHYRPKDDVVAVKMQDKFSSRSASASGPYPSNKLVTLLRSMSMSEPFRGTARQGNVEDQLRCTDLHNFASNTHFLQPIDSLILFTNPSLEDVKGVQQIV